MSVSFNRLQWLISEIHSGRNTQVVFSFNPAQQREKVKFVLDDGYQCHAVYRPCVLGALTAVRCACESSITTDKGHRSSTGKTTVEFWLQQHVNEGAAIVPEDDVSIPSPAEEVIDPSTPLDRGVQLR